MEAHTTFPDTEQVEGILEKLLQIVEQDIPHAATDNDTHNDIEQQILYLFRCKATPGLFASSPESRRGLGTF